MGGVSIYRASAEKLADTAAFIGERATVQPPDVTDAAAVGAMAAHICSALARLDLVVNDASMMVTRRALADLDVGTIDRVLAATSTARSTWLWQCYP